LRHKAVANRSIISAPLQISISRLPGMRDRSALPEQEITRTLGVPRGLAWIALGAVVKPENTGEVCRGENDWLDGDRRRDGVGRRE
jgi:hypothetical protein